MPIVTRHRVEVEMDWLLVIASRLLPWWNDASNGSGIHKRREFWSLSRSWELFLTTGNLKSFPRVTDCCLKASVTVTSRKMTAIRYQPTFGHHRGQNKQNGAHCTTPSPGKKRVNCKIPDTALVWLVDRKKRSRSGTGLPGGQIELPGPRGE